MNGQIKGKVHQKGGGGERRRRKWKRERTQRKRKKEKSRAGAHGLEKPQVLRGLISCGRWECSGRSVESRRAACNHINCVVFSLPGHIWEEIYHNKNMPPKRQKVRK